VHQNFPGQFRDISPELCARGHDIKAISACNRIVDSRVEVLRYEYNGEQRHGVHPITNEVDEWIRRAKLVADRAYEIRKNGWAPDIVMAHPGWGEAMLLSTIFPASPMMIWPELWIKSEHMGVHNGDLTIEQKHYLRIKNWLIDGAMADAHQAILPTRYQAETFPERWKQKISIIPEGVQEELFAERRLTSLMLSQKVVLGPEIKVLTFISRNLEPMRGFDVFMRALPEVQRAYPRLEIVIVGGDGVSYSSSPQGDKTWKETLIEELEGQLDMTRIHFLGRIEHSELIKLYRRSDLHVYLSNEFVLSWSLLEVMATGTNVLLADNPMLNEVSNILSNQYKWLPAKETLSESICNALASNIRADSNEINILRNKYGIKACVDKLERCMLNNSMGRF
jgi:glycosyltransferase involved in cell wall biosynthesis